MVQSWKTVRIFISSTFRDMHAERDHLVKVVFPELRERCAKRKLHLVDIDLRWGVTEEEAEQGKVLEIILDEIDRSRPFFIAILGERYGSVLDNVPEDAKFAHPWLQEYQNHSLTALEIIHGVLRNPDLSIRNFFYFRDPQFIPQIPESKRTDFKAENKEAEDKLTDLKNKIRASGRSLMENYHCGWDDVKQSVVDLDVFGQRVLEDLWAAICEEYPEDVPEADPVAIERQMHEAFVEERSHLHIGRAAEAAKLTEYVQGIDRRTIVITGESGCGKSAFLASWYRKYTSENPDDFVLAYFIGASPDSTNHYRLLRNMCEELKRKFALKEEIPQEDKKLSETLTMLLVAASREKSRIVLLLDALDQLSPLEGAHSLNWLLNYMPEKARLVVSSLEGDCLEILRRREAEEISLPSLTEKEQREILEALLREWRRRLDDKQMKALLAHPGVKNPLYLRVALEELRLFGIFELLTKRIETLEHDIPGQFDQLLARLEKDHGCELVAETFALLGCSRYGLSEKEMLELLRREGEEQFPRAVWARLALSAKVYLVQRGEFIGFFHRQLADAVAARYLSRENKHAKLAAYFAHAPLERKLDEYPYQLQQAEQYQCLAKALSDLDFFDYAWEHNRKYEWMGYWRSIKREFDPTKFYLAAIEVKKEVEGEIMVAARLLDIIGMFLYDMALYLSALLFTEQSLEIKEKAFGTDHPDVAKSLNNLARLYRTQGKYDEAEQLFKRSLAIREKVLPTDHPDIAEALNGLAELYYFQKRYDEAEQLFKRSLAIREKVLPTDHPGIAEALNGLAELYYFQRRYYEAEQLYMRSLALMEKAHPPDHPNVAIALDNLAGFYYSQGIFSDLEQLYKTPQTIREFGLDHPDIAEALNALAKYNKAKGSERSQVLNISLRAEELYKRAIAIKERVFGPDHPDVATTLLKMAKLYRNFGILTRYNEAEELCKRALVIREKVFHPDHPDVAIALDNLGRVYIDQRKYNEAEPLYKRSLVIFEKVFGPDHPDVATALQELGMLYYNQGRYNEAEPLFKRLLEISENVLGSDHLNVAIFLNNLAGSYYNQGKYADAEPLYKRSLAIFEKVFPPEHPDVVGSLDNLAGFYYRQGKYADAEPLYKRLLLIKEKALGHNHPEVAQSLNNLAVMCYAQGKYKETEQLYKRSLAILEKVLPADHPHIAQSLNNLGTLYESQGRYDEAELLHKRSLTIKKKVLSPDHPDTAQSLNNLGRLYEAQRRYDEAEQLYKQSLAIWETVLTPNHPDIARSLSNLAGLYQTQGKYLEAKALYIRALEICENALDQNHPLTATILDNYIELLRKISTR